MQNNVEPKSSLQQPGVATMLTETALGLIKALLITVMVEVSFRVGGMRYLPLPTVFILSATLCFLLWRNRIQTHNTILLQVLAAFELYSKRDKNQ